MLQEEKFWQWFKKHQSEYLHLDDFDDQKKEILLDQFLKQLHEYCNNLYYQIGGYQSIEKRELVITAEGNSDYFDEVERLVNSAPKIDKWKIIAFKQPMGTDIITEYEGLVLDPKKMLFIPLNNEKKPFMVGIRICIDNYDSGNSDKIKQGVYQVLDNILGEKATTADIDYLDIDNLLDYNIENDGLIELIKLREYIDWKKQRTSP